MINLLFFCEKDEHADALINFLSNQDFKVVLSSGKVPVDFIIKEFSPDIILID